MFFALILEMLPCWEVYFRTFMLKMPTFRQFLNVDRKFCNVFIANLGPTFKRWISTILKWPNLTGWLQWHLSFNTIRVTLLPMNNCTAYLQFRRLLELEVCPRLPVPDCWFDCGRWFDWLFPPELFEEFEVFGLTVPDVLVFVLLVEGTVLLVNRMTVFCTNIFEVKNWVRVVTPVRGILSNG